MQTSFLAAKYLRCFLQKGGEACICLWSMFTSTPVYPQGGETHSSDFILLTPGQKVEPTGRFCLYKINVFLINFRVCGCRRRLLTGGVAGSTSAGVHVQTPEVGGQVHLQSRADV